MAHGRYTIVGKLADGGMAEIFLATQHGAEGFEKPVVMKRVLTAFSADPQFRNMFIDEAHISMTLAHGNIVQVLDVGLSGERTFLVLELVEGWDLEDILARAQATGPDHPWPPSLALYVTAQICRGLAYAHAKRAPDGRPLGIVHRDVNPTNVLISEQGEVKLADFGIAKAERKREQTAAGVIKGKIGFMSPEQSTGKLLDARSDLFSVGTMMYLMLTGRKPFDAPTELESMLRSQRADYRPPEELNPYLSPEATAIVNRAMRGDPAGRYQTADEMLIDVERALRGHYNSAGQTELKTWLAALAARDGAVPMGRRAVAAGAVPIAGDGSSSDLSAGVSVQLSDVGVGDAATTVVSAAAPSDLAFVTGLRTPMGAGPPTAEGPPSLPPPSASSAPTFSVPSPPPTRAPLSPGGMSPSPPPLSSSPSLVPSSSPALSPSQSPAGPSASASPPPASGATPAPASFAPLPISRVPSAGVPGRLTRKSRVGLGFVLGALCMLGAVFGIKWLAAWAGREGIVIPHVIEGSGDAAGSRDPAVTGKGEHERAPSGSRDRGGAVAEGAPRGPKPAPAEGAGAAARGATPAAGSAASAPLAPVPAADAAAALGGAGAGTTFHDGGVAGAPPLEAASGRTEHAALTEEDDDEEVLLGRGVPDAGSIIGEDEADAPPPAAPRKEARRPVVAAPPASRSPPVLIRITSSPLGAVVRTKKHVLGRTPLAIRFNAGNTYQLTFVKAGYVTSSRMVAVAGGKPRSISVPMKRSAAAASRRTGLFRGR